MKLASKIESIQSKIRSLRALASPEYISFAEDVLQQENQALESKVEELKYKLCMAELLFGIYQYQTPALRTHSAAAVSSTPVSSASAHPEPLADKTTASKTVESNNVKAASDSPGASKSAGSTKTVGKASGLATAGEAAVDVGRLDMRIGRIVEVSRHPDADSLYVEKVDLGEGRLRTVVSGLVKFVPLEELQNRIGIFMCNLKPAKMRGVESEAMLMCASAPEAGVVEPLVIGSEDVKLGDPVVVPGFEHNPDSQLNPKKKIFEQVKPDLRVDQDGYATYKGVRWTLKSNPSTLIKSAKLKDVQIA
ncbi:hypothetical protein T265_14039 [Opisthorchis viverrini]|uniref:tRNA-binding domain-containing protein n=1 Tax=Opisthorchis viverrini TaxID=6198 RepID=A0A074ZSD3_OPIVI|nr:hypothetical protein T265_14039 [Opisthorchis viverrini]KER26270.1 hypothetical protein T265_14039 [Opisthorchis viverrini]